MNNEKKLMVLDNSVLLSIINEDKKGKTVEMFDKMKKIKKAKGSDKAVAFITTTSCLLKAIHDAKHNANIMKVQEILDTVDIIPFGRNFKDEQELINDTIKFASMISGGMIK